MVDVRSIWFRSAMLSTGSMPLTRLNTSNYLIILHQKQ